MTENMKKLLVLEHREDRNIQSFQQLPSNQASSNAYKHQLFQSVFFSQLKIYFTAKYGKHKFLVHVLMLMLQLSRKQLFRFHGKKYIYFSHPYLPE